MRNKLKSIDNIKFLEILLNILLFSITCAGIVVSIYMNFVNRSLWFDEAMLAYSFSQRSFLNLTNAPLEWMQSAPVGWLYLLKIITLIFGNTEFVLRSVSIIGFVLTLCLVYHISKNYLLFEFPLAGCAFLASMKIMLQYSNIFKPYITDCMFVLLVFVIYKLWTDKKINTAIMAILWSILIWFSNPTCFFEGGLLIANFVLTFDKKSIRDLVRKHMLILVCICISFVIYYFYWLRPVAELGSDMQAYWEGNQFPLIPTSIADIKLAKNLSSILLSPFKSLNLIIFYSMVVGFFFSIKKRSIIMLGMYLGILVSLFASYISMYPISERLWLFFYPIATISFLYVFNLTLSCNKKASIFVYGILFFVINSQNTGLDLYSDSNKVFWSGEETRQQVEYLSEIANEDDYVYVYNSAVPGFTYTNGYEMTSIGRGYNNIIFGNCYFEEGIDYHNEIETILAKDYCYIVLSHWNDTRITGLINSLNDNGYIELVYNQFNTPIYRFYKYEAHSLSNYEIEYLKIDGNYICRIHNTGQTILNHSYEDMYLMCNNIPYALPKMISPDTYVDIIIPDTYYVESCDIICVKKYL